VVEAEAFMVEAVDPMEEVADITKLFLINLGPLHFPPSGLFF